MATSSKSMMYRSGFRPSVCPVGVLTVTHLGAACDMASIHFSLTVMRNDRLVLLKTSGLSNIVNEVCFYQQLALLTVTDVGCDVCVRA